MRSALRTYYSPNGSYTAARDPGTPTIGTADLQGKCLASTDYSLQSVTASTYIIKAGPPSQTTKTTTWYEINQLGSELGPYYTNQ